MDYTTVPLHSERHCFQGHVIWFLLATCLLGWKLKSPTATAPVSELLSLEKRRLLICMVMNLSGFCACEGSCLSLCFGAGAEVAAELILKRHNQSAQNTHSSARFESHPSQKAYCDFTDQALEKCDSFFRGTNLVLSHQRIKICREDFRR